MKLPIKNEWSERNFCHRYASTIQDSQTFGLNYDRVIKTTAKQRSKRRCWNLVIILCSKMLHHACIRLETFQLFYGRKINEQTDRAQTTRPWILQNLRNYMRMTKPEIRVKQVCLPRIMSNVTNNKNELWKTVRLESFQQPLAIRFSHLYVRPSSPRQG